MNETTEEVLVNVAAMIRENPGMLELLRLETAKEMAKSRGNTFVLGGPYALTRSDGQQP